MKKCSNQIGNVVDTSTQRRQFEWDNRKPVVEVLTEGAIFDHGFQVAVRGDDDTRHRLCSEPRAPTFRSRPDWMNRSTLTCRSKGISPISSRKRVPVSADSTLPCLWPIAPVKEPLTCPNSSDSSMTLRKGRKLIVRTAALYAAVEVNGTGEQFLTRSRFAADQHGGVRLELRGRPCPGGRAMSSIG